MGLYQPISIPIIMGRTELTPECAYFLGAIFSADESFLFNDKLYWLAPVRHNHDKSIEKNVIEHLQILKKIIGRANGVIFTVPEMRAQNWFNSKSLENAFRAKQGFAAVFESDKGVSITSIYNDVKNAIDKSPQEISQAFLVGAFDGRSTADRDKKNNKLRGIVLDCANTITANYLHELLGRLGIEDNYNTSRERLEGGEPRKNQLRILGKNAQLFMEKVGIISPVKFKQWRAMLPKTMHTHIDNNILWGLKTLSQNKQTGRVINMLAPDDLAEENILDELLLESIPQEAEDGFQYSKKPKEKAKPKSSKGRKVYPRDQKVAANALSLANYKCCIDETHPTFLRKNCNNNYVEPHHIVPLAFYDIFSVSLDVEENVVSLCSHCHNNLHYGKDIIPLLIKLYDERNDLLRLVGIDITLQELYKMYGV